MYIIKIVSVPQLCDSKSHKFHLSDHKVSRCNNHSGGFLYKATHKRHKGQVKFRNKGNITNPNESSRIFPSQNDRYHFSLTQRSPSTWESLHFYMGPSAAIRHWEEKRVARGAARTHIGSLRFREYFKPWSVINTHPPGAEADRGREREVTRYTARGCIHEWVIGMHDATKWPRNSFHLATCAHLRTSLRVCVYEYVNVIDVVDTRSVSAMKFLPAGRQAGDNRCGEEKWRPGFPFVIAGRFRYSHSRSSR